MFTIRGKITFDPEDKTNKHTRQGVWKKAAIVLLYCDTYKYYAWFLEKRFNITLQRPLRFTHFTIINDRITTKEDLVKYEECKKKWDGKEVEFTYNPEYRTNGKHFWFRIYSEDALQIRKDAGLGKYEHGLHLTVGLVSEKDLDYAAYRHRQMLKFPNNC